MKTALVTKPEKYQAAVTVFEGTGVNVTDVGKRYLGGALGSEGFIAKFAESKISEWTKEIERLSDFARSQPHAAFVAFCHGVCHRWTYVTQVVPIAEECLQPLEKVIRMTFLPALTGQTAFNDEIRPHGFTTTSWWIGDNKSGKSGKAASRLISKDLPAFNHSHP